MKLIISSFLILCCSTFALAQTKNEKSFLDYFERYTLPITDFRLFNSNKYLPVYLMERYIWGYEPDKNVDLNPGEINKIQTCYDTGVLPNCYYTYKETTFIIFSYDWDDVILGVLNKDSILTENINLGDCFFINNINIQGDSITVEYGNDIEVRDTSYYYTNPIKHYIYDFDKKKFTLSDTSSIKRLYTPGE